MRARLQVLRGAVDEILPHGGNGRPVAIRDVPAHSASRWASRSRDLRGSARDRPWIHPPRTGRARGRGRTAARLLVKAPCSLAVAPRGFRDQQQTSFERVAVAVDGCADCEDALHEAMSLTSALAGSPGGALRGAAPGRIRATPRRAELLARVDAMLERCGAGDMKRQSAEGSPAAAIARAAEDFDLLVVGCRAAGGPLGHPTLRSVSRELMHSTGCR